MCGAAGCMCGSCLHNARRPAGSRDREPPVVGAEPQTAPAPHFPHTEFLPGPIVTAACPCGWRSVASSHAHSVALGADHVAERAAADRQGCARCADRRAGPLMATLVTVATAAERAGKSERSIWRYVERLEAEGIPSCTGVPACRSRSSTTTRSRRSRFLDEARESAASGGSCESVTLQDLQVSVVSDTISYVGWCNRPLKAPLT